MFGMFKLELIIFGHVGSSKYEIESQILVQKIIIVFCSQVLFLFSLEKSANFGNFSRKPFCFTPKKNLVLHAVFFCFQFQPSQFSVILQGRFGSGTGTGTEGRVRKKIDWSITGTGRF